MYYKYVCMHIFTFMQTFDQLKSFFVALFLFYTFLWNNFCNKMMKDKYVLESFKFVWVFKCYLSTLRIDNILDFLILHGSCVTLIPTLKSRSSITPSSNRQHFSVGLQISVDT